MQAVRVQLHLRSTRRAAEEVDDTSLAHDVNRPFPRCRTSYSINHHVGTAALACERASRRDDALNSSHLQHATGAEQPCCGDLILPLHNGNHLDTGELGNVHEHESDRTCPDHHHGVASLRSTLLQPTYNARQRFGQCGMLQRNFIRHKQSVLFHDPCRNSNKFCIGSVVEQKVLAQILLPMSTKKTSIARS